MNFMLSNKNAISSDIPAHCAGQSTKPKSDCTYQITFIPSAAMCTDVEWLLIGLTRINARQTTTTGYAQNEMHGSTRTPGNG